MPDFISKSDVIFIFPLTVVSESHFTIALRHIVISFNQVYLCLSQFNNSIHDLHIKFVI